ncbi:hypothetical protein Ahy_B03g066072 [Arachis hypogaea]|uniref:Aminotransferase-like plant mobile domain-containing protein n=1 Tax=Arachis hypogaea TaxID=3818 RepID=A0A445A305_ARAHY|nr:hypothetical protein Ahy_B03g066072 [Arachis hypogaea]
MKWTVKLSWFLNTVCGDLEEDATEERLLRYTRGWLPLLEDLDTCGRLSWGSAMLAWLYHQMCRATEHSQCNLGCCVSLLLSWAYYHIPLLRLDGFETRRFPLVERWVEYRSYNDRGENKLRHYRRTLNGIDILYVIDWMSYADLQLQGVVPPGIVEAEASAAIVCTLLYFAIVKWHQSSCMWHRWMS